MATVPNPAQNTTSGKAQAAAPVTKADAALPDGDCIGLWVGTGGTANLMDVYGNTLTNFPLVAGPNPIAVKQVRTGGTASDIWALY